MASTRIESLCLWRITKKKWEACIKVLW